MHDGVPSRNDAWADPHLRAGVTEAAMGILYLVGAAVSAGLFVYLVFAMLAPERF